MKTQHGSALILTLLFGVAIFIVLMATWIDSAGISLGKLSLFEDGQEAGGGILSKKVVEIRIEDTKSGDVQMKQINVVPEKVAGYRITLMNTDYDTNATVLVENLGKEVYETVTITSGEARLVGDIVISIEQFIYKPCDDGKDC